MELVSKKNHRLQIDDYIVELSPLSSNDRITFRDAIIQHRNLQNEASALVGYNIILEAVAVSLKRLEHKGTECPLEFNGDSLSDICLVKLFFGDTRLPILNKLALAMYDLMCNDEAFEITTPDGSQPLEGVTVLGSKNSLKH